MAYHNNDNSSGNCKSVWSPTGYIIVHPQPPPLAHGPGWRRWWRWTIHDGINATTAPQLGSYRRIMGKSEQASLQTKCMPKPARQSSLDFTAAAAQFPPLSLQSRQRCGRAETPPPAPTPADPSVCHGTLFRLACERHPLAPRYFRHCCTPLQRREAPARCTHTLRADQQADQQAGTSGPIPPSGVGKTRSARWEITVPTT